MIRNHDADESAYRPFKDLYRPYADFSTQADYGHRDWRGGGGLSAKLQCVALLEPLPSWS